jgi:hypothetical protein
MSPSHKVTKRVSEKTAGWMAEVIIVSSHCSDFFRNQFFGVSFHYNATFLSKIYQYQLAKAEYVTTHHAQTGLIGCCGMGWGGSYIILFGPLHLLHKYRLCSLETRKSSIKKQL